MANKRAAAAAAAASAPLPPPPSNGRAWTPGQWDGITAAGQSLLLSAAAGSGKTAVLSERCAYLVCDAPDVCGVDELLVVTFTESAAAEMKGRMQQALRDRLAKAPHDDRLRRQLALAEYAQVSTVHGFCSRLLRQNFNLLGLDPGFQIIDADEAALLRNEVARDLFRRRYEEDESGDFHRLIDAYGNGDDAALVARVVNTHELLNSLIDPAGWIAQAKRRLTSAAADPLEKSALGRAMLKIVEVELAALRQRCDDAIASIRGLPGCEAYAVRLSEWLPMLDHWAETLRSEGFDALAEISKDFDPPAAPRVKSDVPGKDLAKALHDDVKKQIREGSLSAWLSFPSAAWRDGVRAIVPHADELLALVAEFSQDYAEAKQTARGLDFADLERLSLQVLCESSAAKMLEPSEVARACHARFRHVLVDEYQDINEIQDAILTLVSCECVCREGKRTANLFCVGDVKQSIFRFRLAEPKRFLDRHKKFRAAGNGVGRVIDLRENFRSRGPLLEAINAVFERLMTEEAADVLYDESHRLREGLVYPPGDNATSFRGAPIELHLLPANVGGAGPASAGVETDESAAAAELERTDYEAMLVARRIRRIMGADGGPRMQVVARDASGAMTPRPVAYGDIVILLRSPKYKADTFVDVLRRNGIPVHSEGGTGFFNSTEIRDVLALLNVLDNARQDVPLAALLRSPIASLPEPEDAMAKVVLACRDEAPPVPFHVAVRRYADEQRDALGGQLRELFAKLDDWRDQARKRPVAEVLWHVYNETGYLAFCAGLDDGPQRVANLVYLHERARQFGSFLRQGLYRFLRFVESLKEEKDLSRPSIAGEADQVVRVMSVHRSKGLEFPIVFLPDMGKRHNVEDCKGPILIDRAAGLGMEVVEEERRIRYPSLASAVVQHRLRRQTLAEELRLLYVAMTRAKEHLILVGTCPPKQVEQWASLWTGREGPLPADVVTSANTPLDWLGPVAAMTAGASDPVLEVTPYAAEDVAGWSDERAGRPALTEAQQRLAGLVPLDPPPAVSDDAARVIARFEQAYPFRAYTDVPAAVAAREWAGTGQTSAAALSLPTFLAEERVISPADVGEATHRVLQHLDFSGEMDDEAIGRQVDRLVDRKLISAAQAVAVDRDAIAWFVASDAGRWIAARQGTIRRELSFAVAAPADGAENSNDPMDQVMVRGRIDLLVEDEGGYAIVDYKTDRVAAAAVDGKAREYEPQVRLYADAVARVTGKPVTKTLLVFLAARRVVELR